MHSSPLARSTRESISMGSISSAASVTMPTCAISGTVNNNEAITFRAYNDISGETLLVTETIEFQGQSLGYLDTPMQLHAQTVTTGIDTTVTMSDVRSILSVSGNRINRLRRGVNIVTKANGTTVKIVVE